MSDAIGQIRQREQAATPGPWGWRGKIRTAAVVVLALLLALSATVAVAHVTAGTPDPSWQDVP